MSTPAEIFTKIAKNAEANPEGATQADAIFQFNITGDNGGTFVLDMTKGKTSDFLSTEPNENAHAVISVDGSDWSGMVDGSVDPMQAFMGGKVKVDGDMTQAMKLPGLMKLAR